MSLSLSNFIKTILNIQDNNISFPEEEYCQVTKKGDYRIKVFKSFQKKDYCTCPQCSSKNIVKNGSRHRKFKYIPKKFSFIVLTNNPNFNYSKYFLLLSNFACF